MNEKWLSSGTKSRPPTDCLSTSGGNRQFVLISTVITRRRSLPLFVLSFFPSICLFARHLCNGLHPLFDLRQADKQTLSGRATNADTDTVLFGETKLTDRHLDKQSTDK